MLMTDKRRTAADYRKQAEHLREFIVTIRNDERLRLLLLSAVAKLEMLAGEVK
jgi:hypothetical protein